MVLIAKISIQAKASQQFGCHISGERFTLKVPGRMMTFTTIVITLFCCLLRTWSWTGWCLKCLKSTICSRYHYPIAEIKKSRFDKLCNLSSVIQIESDGARSIHRSNDSRAHYWALPYRLLELGIGQPFSPKKPPCVTGKLQWGTFLFCFPISSSVS